MKPLVSLFLVDDHKVILQGLERLFSDEDSLTVTGTATGYDEALSGILRTDPDVALVDLFLNQQSGITLVNELKKAHLKTKYILFTGEPYYAESDSGIHSLFHGLVLKSGGRSDLIDTIRQVSLGNYYYGGNRVDTFENSEISTRRNKFALTPIELRVVDLIADGLSNKDISVILKVKPKTIENKRYQIMQKLGLRGRNSLVKYAMKQKTKKYSLG